ncbi:MAG: DedA family protein [Ectothiorhodospira sp.]
MPPETLSTEVVREFGHWALGLLMVVVAPEALMPFAGFLAHEGMLGFWPSVLAGTLGATFGSALIYAVVRRAGEPRVRSWMVRHGRWLLLHESDLDRILALFARRGRWIVALGRLLPSVRSLVNIPAGLMPMPVPTFLWLTVLGTLAWNLVLTLAGYCLGAQWRVLEPYLGVYGALVMVVLLLLVGIFAVRRLLQRSMEGP